MPVTELRAVLCTDILSSSPEGVIRGLAPTNVPLSGHSFLRRLMCCLMWINPISICRLSGARAILPRSIWGRPSSLSGRWDDGEVSASLHCRGSTARRMLSENTARMGDEGNAVRRRGAPTALLFEGQYRISKSKYAVSIMAVTLATESTNASRASW